MKGPARAESAADAARRARDLADLHCAIAALRDEGEAARFLRDLATPAELEAFAERWAIARLLDEGRFSYRGIAAETGASTTTIARVARFLREEEHQGYRLLLDRLGRTARRKQDKPGKPGKAAAYE